MLFQLNSSSYTNSCGAKVDFVLLDKTFLPLKMPRPEEQNQLLGIYKKKVE